MKPRLILFCLFVAVIAAFGATRWYRRFRAASDFHRSAVAGKWRLVVADRYSGMALWNVETWEKRNLSEFGDAWFGLTDLDVAPELSQIVVTRDDPRGDPIALERAYPRAARTDPRRAYSGYELMCARLLEDGSVFYLEGIPNALEGNLRRLGVTANDGHDHPDEDPLVELPVRISRNTCFDLSRDGRRIAWLGTDGQIHTGERAGDTWTDQKSWPAPPTLHHRDMQITPDQRAILIATSGLLERFDLLDGTRRMILEDSAIQSLLEITPDSRFALVELYQGGPHVHGMYFLGSLRDGEWGVRLDGGALFPLGLPRAGYQPSMRWVPSADTLAKP